MKYLLAEFIPIILIFLFLSKNKEFFQFSRTIPGKLVAVGLIVFYALTDKILGLLVCGLVILFYQSDNIESMELLGSEFNLDEIQIVPENPTIVEYEPVDDGIYISMQPVSSKERKMKKTFVAESEVLITSSADHFRKENCEKGQLTHKGMKVKNEMAEHVFPEMKFNNIVCNPCSKNCEISVINEKLNTEKVLRQPMNP
jgi:hypothetical protein